MKQMTALQLPQLQEIIYNFFENLISFFPKTRISTHNLCIHHNTSCIVSVSFFFWWMSTLVGLSGNCFALLYTINSNIELEIQNFIHSFIFQYVSSFLIWLLLLKLLSDYELLLISLLFHCVLSGWVMFNSLQPYGLPPGSSVHGIIQAGILEWVAIFSSRGSSCFITIIIMIMILPHGSIH